MIEAIRGNCQNFVQYLSRSEFHNLIYVSLLFIIVLGVFALVKTFLIFRKSRNFTHKLELKSIQYPGKIRKILDEIDLKDKVVVFKSKKLSAFCYGFKKPKIYISLPMAKTASEDELKAVLKHEQFHLHHRDSITLCILNVAQSMVWPFPGFTNIIKNIHINREIKADQYAASYLGDKRPLLSVIKKLLEEPVENPAFVPGIGNYETLEPRIHALTKGNYNLRTINSFHVLISIFFLLGLFFVLILPVYAHNAHNTPNNVNLLCPGISAQNASYPFTPAN